VQLLLLQLQLSRSNAMQHPNHAAAAADAFMTTYF
jgi:hypothetical protein